MIGVRSWLLAVVMLVMAVCLFSVSGLLTLANVNRDIGSVLMAVTVTGSAFLIPLLLLAFRKQNKNIFVELLAVAIRLMLRITYGFRIAFAPLWTKRQCISVLHLVPQ